MQVWQGILKRVLATRTMLVCISAVWQFILGVAPRGVWPRVRLCEGNALDLSVSVYATLVEVCLAKSGLWESSGEAVQLWYGMD